MASLRNSFSAAPVRRMADGGIVSALPNLAGSLRGWMTGHTDQRIADATASAPQPTAAPAMQVEAANPMATSGAASLRTPTNPAGIRFAHGGPVRGPGTGTSDSIPARLSHGEYVLPADTVKAVGVDKLDAIKDATHTPVTSLRGGYANGGIPDPTKPNSLGDAAAAANNTGVTELQPKPMAGGNAVPGMTASEMSPTPPISNPNVGPAGSTEAQSFRAAQTGSSFGDAAAASNAAANGAPAVAAPTAAEAGAGAAEASTLGKAAYGAGRVAATGLRAAGAMGPALAGGQVINHFNDYKINDPSVDSSAGGTLRAAGNDIGQGNWSFPATRASLGKGALEAGMDVGSAAANALDFIAPGKNSISTAYGQSLRGTFGNQLQAAPGVAAGGAAPAPAAAGGAPAGAGSATPSSASGAYPEAGPIRAAMAGVDNSAPAGAPTSLRGNPFSDGSTPPGNGGGGVSDLSGASVSPAARAAQSLRDVQSQQQLDDAKVAQARINDPTPGMGVIANNDPANAQKMFDGADLRTALSHGSWSPRKGFQGDETAVNAALAQQKTNADLTGQSLRNQAALTEAGMQNRTTQRGQDMVQATTLRGQDVDLQAKQWAAQAALAERQREQANADRQFGLEVHKTGTAEQQQNFNDAQAAQKNITEQIAATLPPGADGKADTATAARYMTGLNAVVANRMQLLQAHLQKNPGDQTAQSELAGLQQRGVAMLGQGDVRRHVAGMQLSDVANATGTGGLTPWGTRAVNSSAPIQSIKKNANGDYVSDRGDVIPGRYVDKVDSTLGMGGRKNNNFDILKTN